MGFILIRFQFNRNPELVQDFGQILKNIGRWHLSKLKDAGWRQVVWKTYLGYRFPKHNQNQYQSHVYCQKWTRIVKTSCAFSNLRSARGTSIRAYFKSKFAEWWSCSEKIRIHHTLTQVPKWNGDIAADESWPYYSQYVPQSSWCPRAW